MAFEIKGLKDTQQNLERLKNAAKHEFRAANRRAGGLLLATVKNRTRREYQEVVSYVFESILGLPGTKPEYAVPGLIGTFARTAPTLTAPWDRSVQKYREVKAKGHHPLHTLLRSTYSETPTGLFVTKVGYPEGTGGKGTNTRFIVWVMFGTAKMQPRPFLELALDEAAPNFLKEVKEAIQRLMYRF